jgi:hypothetical protein
LLNTPEKREPLIWTALVISVFFAVIQYQRYDALRDIIFDLRRTMKTHMAPLVQPVRGTRVSLLAGQVCGSDDCQPELAGWAWAVNANVEHQSQCYGDDGPGALALSGGCDSYVKALHLPTMPEE